MTADLLGAFARIFHRDTAEEIAEAFATRGLTQVQLNLSALGLPTIPGEVELAELDLAGIRTSFTAHGTVLWGVSATFNTAHPDAGVRSRSTRAARDFIAALAPSGAVAATLCSGSRDPDDMWARHPETAGEEAWHDFRAALDELLPAAEAAGVVLAIEPEPANTVADVDRALRLVRELGPDADRIGFILDPANLVSDVARSDHVAVLARAFAELGERTVCVHAKDTVPWEQTLRGDGVVDYGHVAQLYHALPRPVPLIIQDATERELTPIANGLRRGFFGA